LIEKKDITTLVKLGLTVNQAKTYLANLKTGPCTAKELSKTAGIAIQDIYRVIPPLQKLGLEQRIITKPTTFRANPLKLTIPILLQQKDLELNNLHKASLELENKQAYESQTKLKDIDESKFLIISGKQSIFKKSNQVIKNASKNICISTLWESGRMGSFRFRKLIIKGLKKQVKFRFIINIPMQEIDNYLNIMSEFSVNPFFEIRFIERCSAKKHLVFSIFDNHDVLFSIKEAPLGESPLLWSNNKQFIELVQNAFEFMWMNTIKN
jgi:sugar-specific transcriptional regulator TrmB